MTITLTDANFFDTIGTLKASLVIVDCWSPAVESCRHNAAEISAVGNLLGEGCEIGKLNVEKAPNAVGRLQLQAVPACVIFVQGEPVRHLYGVHTMAEVLKASLVDGLDAKIDSAIRKSLNDLDKTDQTWENLRRR